MVYTKLLFTRISVNICCCYSPRFHLSIAKHTAKLINASPQNNARIQYVYHINVGTPVICFFFSERQRNGKGYYNIHLNTSTSSHCACVCALIDDGMQLQLTSCIFIHLHRYTKLKRQMSKLKVQHFGVLILTICYIEYGAKVRHQSLYLFYLKKT